MDGGGVGPCGITVRAIVVLAGPAALSSTAYLFGVVVVLGATFTIVVADPELQETVAGKPDTVAEPAPEENVHSGASVTVADRVTAPPAKDTGRGLPVKFTIVGLGGAWPIVMIVDPDVRFVWPRAVSSTRRCLLVSAALGATVTMADAVPESHGTVEGRPEMSGGPVNVHWAAPVTEAESVTGPPVHVSKAGVAVKFEMTGRGVAA
jgi:hypothetical protein